MQEEQISPSKNNELLEERNNLVQEDQLEEPQVADEENITEQSEEGSFLNVVKKNARVELIEIAKLSWPIIISNVMQSLLGVVDMAFVGHLGKDYLAAAALGNAFFMSFGYAPSTLSSAQDVLVSQAEGMKNERAKRAVLYRSVMIVTIAFLPVFAMFMFSDQILHHVFRQDMPMSKLTGRFIKLNSIGLYPFCISAMLARYLNAQSCVLFPMFTTILANVVNAILNYLLIRGVGYEGLGFDGAPIATSLTRTFIMFVLIMFTVHFERSKPKIESEDEEQEETKEKEPTLQALKRIFFDTIKWSGTWEYLKLGIPGMFQIMLEIWGFELTTIFSGLLPGSIYVAAHSVCLNVLVITFMIPLSISIASAIRIGQCLGAEMAVRAKLVATLSVFVSVAFMSLNGFQLLALRKVYGKLFTSDQDVVALVAGIMPICALFQVVDGAQVSLNAILYGTGKLTISAIAKLLSFYVFGLPLGALLCFYFDLKLSGLWIGLAIGLFAVSVLVLVYISIRLDFQSEVENAKRRVLTQDTSHSNTTVGAESQAEEMDSVVVSE